MNVGYCRVSTTEQNLDLQVDALKAAGCSKIFEDVASGAKDNRSGLQAALEFVRNGDTLVAWRLDRIGRSLAHLIGVINELSGRGVGFRSLNESIDSTSASGRLVLHVFGALAEFERSLLKERTQAGLVAARARGRLGGRPRAMDEKMIAMARAMLKAPDARIGDVSAALGVSRSSLYRHVGVLPIEHKLGPNGP